jgi:hypothetical protein
MGRRKRIMHTGFLWGKPEGKRPLGRPRHMLDNSKMTLREIGWTGLIWLRIRTNRWLFSTW